MTKEHDGRIERYLHGAVRGLWGRKRGEVREELQAHIQVRLAAHRLAGLSETAAVERTLRELGGFEEVNADMNRLYALPPLFGEALRRVLRHLQTKPLRTLLTLLQVLLGTLAMTVALNAYLGTLGNRDARRFVVVAGSRDGGSPVSWNIFQADDMQKLLSLAPAVEAVARYGVMWSDEILYQDERYALRSAARVDPSFFELAGIDLVHGSFFTQGDARNRAAVVVISEGIADTLFGATNPIGQVFTLLPFSEIPDPSPRRTYRVVGTFNYEENTLLSYFNRPAPVYFPAWFAGISSTNTSSIRVFAKPGQSEAARRQILAAVGQVYRDAPELRHYDLALGEGFYIEELGQDYRYVDRLNPNIIIFGLFGIIALIIGTIGIFSATVVNVAERTHEIGVRRSLGASATRIGLEFMSESGALAAFGGFCGVLLAALVIPWLGAQVGSELFAGVQLIWRPLAALAVLALVVLLSAFFSLFPALQVGRRSPVIALREA